MLATAILTALVLTAAVTDLVWRRIYNWTTYPGMIAALALSLLGWGIEFFAPSTAASWKPLLGWIDLSDCLAGFFACGFAMALCFVFFPTGGGDVKLLAMIGAFTGLYRGLEVLLWTFVFGGVVGLVILIWQLGPISLVRRAGSLAYGAVTMGVVTGPTTNEEEKLSWPVFLGPCAACALAAVLLPWPWKS